MSLCGREELTKGQKAAVFLMHEAHLKDVEDIFVV